MRIPLLGGAYTTQSVFVDAQRCINLYPEKNPEDAEAQLAHYCTPGLTVVGSVPGGSGWRGLYYSSVNQTFYGVCGTGVYTISGSFLMTQIGTIASGTTPVSMIDNGIQLVIVAGQTGYYVTLSTNVVTQITDSAFYGSDRVGYIDTFFVFNQPNSKNWYTSLSNSITFDPTYIVAKTGSTDQLVAAVTNHREIYVVGERTTEVFYDAGASGFPFATIVGSYIEHGCMAKYSIAVHDNYVYFLSQDRDGAPSAVAVGPDGGYRAKRISTPAVEQEWQGYVNPTDAVSYCYKQAGHVFYVLNFTTDDKTWVYDIGENLWHQRDDIDSNGVSHRHPGQCHAYAFGFNIVGDYQNGNLYKYDLNNFTNNGNTVRRLRTLPHVLDKDTGKKLIYNRFSADIEVGTVSGTATSTQSELTLRWSYTRGKSWLNPVIQNLGSTGQYILQPTWRRLGVGRSLTLELSWSIPAPIALTGAWLDITPSVT